MSEYIVKRRIERELRRRGSAAGLRGDPLDNAQPVADTAAEQLAAVAVWLNLPQAWRRHRESWDMTRATAFGPRRRAGT